MALILPPHEILSNVADIVLPTLEVNCVIFGFHSQQLKVLLLQPHEGELWVLPGGLIEKEEDVDAAAVRVLRERTGLSDIFLRQFHLFGAASRAHLTLHPAAAVFKSKYKWFDQRFVSMGYYALVDYTAVAPQPDGISLACQWWTLDSMPPLVQDHLEMVTKALGTLRQRLRQEPIGYQLLPDKFTLAELQKLYEAILGRPLDKRNFQRKLLSYGILQPLDERRTGGAHKAPRLHSFDMVKYQQALEQGLQGDW